MQTMDLKRSRRALVIVAHPDDETIWMGGTILLNPNVHWTIFSLCRGSDKDRAPKFKRICKIYGAKAIITDLEDQGRLTIGETVPQIKKYLLSNIKNRNFDYIFTHGRNGEYGHPRHVGAYRAVKELISEKKLNTDKLFFFNYKKNLRGRYSSMAPKKDSEITLSLSDKIFMKKKRLQSEIHGYEWNGIDNRLCTKIEAFKTI